jgi:hypothetical protein
MRAAPPVSYPLGPCFFQRALYVAIAMGATVVWLAWTLSQSALEAQVALAVCMLGLMVWAVQDVQVVPAWLVWDGESWHWETPQGQACEGQVKVAWDAQQALLLRFDTPSAGAVSAPRWIWVDCGSDAALWDDLRRAVHAHRPQLNNFGGLP